MAKGVLVLSCIVLLLTVVMTLSRTSHRAWLLLFSGDREEALKAWKKYAPINTAVIYPMRPIAEVQAVGKKEEEVGVMGLMSMYSYVMLPIMYCIVFVKERMSASEVIIYLCDAC